jgi:mono/diheme cytochrome c family protein
MADQKPNLKLPPIPRPLLYFVIISVVASWVPLAMIARARVTTSPKPRIHLIQDMDAQPRFDAESAALMFQDHRAMRLPVAGTVAYADALGDRDAAIEEDDHYYRGYETDGNGKPVIVKDAGGNDSFKWIAGFPKQVKVDRALLDRGRERFNIYCGICHGLAGYGDGMVNRRAQREGVASGWVPPVNLHMKDASTGKLLYTTANGFNEGRLFNTISAGARTMPAYAKQISVADRWAIVAYVRALQFAQNLPADKAPQGAKIETIAEFMSAAPKPAAPAAAAPAGNAGGASGGAAPAAGGKVNYDDPALIAQGKALFQSKICFTCHAVPGGPPVPTCPSFVDGIIGKKEKVTIGVGGPVQEITVDEAYFRESIKQPMAKVVVNSQTGQPYPPVMVLPFPPTDDEITALFAYVRSLSKK